MARRLRCALTVCAFLAIGQGAAAQTLGQAAAAARKAPQIDPALRADIEKLMVVTGQAELGIQFANTMSEAFLKGFQETQHDVPPRVIAIVHEVILKELAAAFTGPEIKDKMVALYARYFTHAEVKALVAFYNSDLGRKTISNMPNLMREAAAIGQEWAEGAMPKMLQILEGRLKAEGLLP
jgi:uncharacterized protein